jgi:hypothetical protein
MFLAIRGVIAYDATKDALGEKMGAKPNDH